MFEADELRDSGRQMREGQGGVIRIGMGSGPGAMLMTPLLMRMATRHPKVRVVVSRGGTDLLAQALRARTLDALVVDARSLKPAADLEVSALREMRGVFMCRRGHPLDAASQRRELRSGAALPDRLHAAERRGGAHPGRGLRTRGAPGASA